MYRIYVYLKTDSDDAQDADEYDAAPITTELVTK